MAVLQPAVLNAWDDDTAVNVGGSWSNQESGHGIGEYTFVPEPTWDYGGVYPVIGAAAAGSGAGPVVGNRWIRGEAVCC
jgi:hypothetical protein